MKLVSKKEEDASEDRSSSHRPGERPDDEGERECRICHSSEDQSGGWLSPCRYADFVLWWFVFCIVFHFLSEFIFAKMNLP
jgi:hypothetical protein